MRSLLPFSLEDQFATDIDELHFAAGITREDGRTAASVIAISQLDAWLELLADAGVKPQAAFSESDGIPAIPSTTVFLLDGESIFGRRAGQVPFRLEAFSLSNVWQLLVSDDEDRAADLRHLLIYASTAELSSRAGELDELRNLVDDLAVRELRDGKLHLLASALAAGSGTNLLQGAYAPKSNISGLLRPWYAAASLAAALILVVFAGEAVEWFKLAQADSALTEQTGAICSASFGAPQLSTCRAEVQRRLANMGQQSDSRQESFLTTLSVVADAAMSAGELEALSYRNRVLDLEIVLPDVSELDAFTQRVARSELFEVRTLSNTSQDDGLRSRVQVVVKP